MDFLVNNDTYVEVKTPLQNLQVTLGDHVRTRPQAPFDSTDRMVKHLTELGRSLSGNQRAILIVCFLYDNPGFKVLPSTDHRVVKCQVNQAIQRGVELWQVNFRLNDTGARVMRYNRLDKQLIDAPNRESTS